MFITKLSLPRRTFLRGMGVTLALPLLESMVPALTATAKTAANPQRRFGVVDSNAFQKRMKAETDVLATR